MDTTLTNGRKVKVIKDGFGRAYVEEDEVYLRYNRETKMIMADAKAQEGEFVTIDGDGDFVVWRPPRSYSQN